ncbi:MAG: helix-turn-helix transcriptional regulator [Puniceicoccaceae bacterium]
MQLDAFLQSIREEINDLTLIALEKCLRSIGYPNGTVFSLVDKDGSIQSQITDRATAGQELSTGESASMIRESLRWGEPYYGYSFNDALVIALPFTLNSRLVGGVLIQPPEDESDAADDMGAIRKLTDHLAVELDELNLLNMPLMRERFLEARRERMRAEAIHSLKSEPLHQIREIYWRLEPELFLAMRKRERTESRRLLNQILIGIYNFGGEDIIRVKGFILDLVSMMTRTMVDCGASPADTLGRGFDIVRELELIHDEESLSSWVTNVLESLMEAVERSSDSAEDMRMQLAVNYIRENCGEPLSRDDVAMKVGLSPSHFSRLIVSHLGHSFSDELRKVRIAKAARMLKDRSYSAKEVSIACGFQDQSYFSKVFKKEIGKTPLEYAHRA